MLPTITACVTYKCTCRWLQLGGGGGGEMCGGLGARVGVGGYLGPIGP